MPRFSWRPRRGRSSPATPDRPGSAKDPRVSDRVAAGLRPHAQPVRTAADLHAAQEPAGPGAERIDLAVVAAAEPEHAAVRADAAHVGRAATRDAPLAQRPSRLEREHGDRAL